MDRQEIFRSARCTVPVALALMALAAPLSGWAWALCYGASALWGAANLASLALVLDALVAQRALVPGLLAVQLKLVVLFGGLALIVMAPLFNLWAFLAGFHTVFGVVLTLHLRATLFAGAPARRAA
mgnify:CR=1 FL=1